MIQNSIFMKLKSNHRQSFLKYMKKILNKFDSHILQIQNKLNEFKQQSEEKQIDQSQLQQIDYNKDKLLCYLFEVQINDSFMKVQNYFKQLEQIFNNLTQQLNLTISKFNKPISYLEKYYNNDFKQTFIISKDYYQNNHQNSTYKLINSKNIQQKFQIPSIYEIKVKDPSGIEYIEKRFKQKILKIQSQNNQTIQQKQHQITKLQSKLLPLYIFPKFYYNRLLNYQQNKIQFKISAKLFTSQINNYFKFGLTYQLTQLFSHDNKKLFDLNNQIYCKIIHKQQKLYIESKNQPMLIRWNNQWEYFGIKVQQKNIIFYGILTEKKNKEQKQETIKQSKEIVDQTQVIISYKLSPYLQDKILIPFFQFNGFICNVTLRDKYKNQHQNTVQTQKKEQKQN